MSRFAPIKTPLPWALEFQRVDRPVSSYHGGWYADQLAFLLAHNLPMIASISTGYYEHASNDSVIKFPYYPSPGARALVVGCVLYRGQAEVTFAGGTFIDIGTQPLDGSTSLQGAPPLADTPVLYAVMEAQSFSGLSTITLTRHPVASSYGSIASGIQNVFAFEVPRAAIDPVSSPTTDVSFNRAWPIPPGKLIDGSASSSRGFTRMLDQINSARSEVRAHRTLATLEDTTNAWQTTSTSYTPLIASGCEWYCRARRLYTTSSPNPQTLYVRYRSDQQWSLRVKTTVNGVTTNNDFTTIPANAGSFTTYTSSLNLSTAHNTAGEEQQVKVELEYKLNSAGTLYVSCVSLIENET